jgi:hypothetical protein
LYNFNLYKDDTNNKHNKPRDLYNFNLYKDDTNYKHNKIKV